MDFDVGSVGFIGSRAMIMLLWPDELICIYARFGSPIMPAALVKVHYLAVPELLA